MTNAPRTLAWTVAAFAVVGYFLFSGARDFPHEIPVDLYYPWGLPIAQRNHVSNANPYSDPAPYGEFLSRYSKESGSRTLRYVGDLWEARSAAKIEPIGTPLFYAAYAAFPEDFDQARGLFKVLQYAALMAAIYLLTRLRGMGPASALCLGGFVGLTFSPFVQDVRVGNVNTLQLFVLCAMTWIAAKRLYDRYPLLDHAYLAALAAFVMLKPNTLVIALGLALHYGLARGHRRFVRGSIIALVVAALCLAYTAWHFGDPNVWLDWIRYIRGAHGGMLVYPSSQGNVSLPLMFAEKFTGPGVAGFTLIIAAALLVAGVIAMTRWGKRGDLLVPTARALLDDPGFVLSAGILATLATAPLVWQHYLLFAIAPIIWFFRFDGRWGLATWCSLLAYIGFFKPMRYVLDNETYEMLYPFLILSWVPLLVAMHAYIVAKRRLVASSG